MLVRILTKMLGYDKAHQRPSDELAEFQGARQPIGRTKRGMNTKLHGVSDADGRPLSVFMTPDRSATTQRGSDFFVSKAVKVGAAVLGVRRQSRSLSSSRLCNSAQPVCDGAFSAVFAIA